MQMTNLLVKFIGDSMVAFRLQFCPLLLTKAGSKQNSLCWSTAWLVPSIFSWLTVSLLTRCPNCWGFGSSVCWLIWWCRICRHRYRPIQVSQMLKFFLCYPLPGWWRWSETCTAPTLVPFRGLWSPRGPKWVFWSPFDPPLFQSPLFLHFRPENVSKVSAATI